MTIKSVDKNVTVKTDNNTTLPKGAGTGESQLLFFILTIPFSLIHSGWPSAGAAAVLLLCEGNFGT